MSSENRDSASSDDPEDEQSSRDEPIDLHGPSAEEREGSKWAGYALAGFLLVLFLVGFLRLVYPAGTGLLIGALGVLFGLAIVVLAVRERFGG